MISSRLRWYHLGLFRPKFGPKFDLQVIVRHWLILFVWCCTFWFYTMVWNYYWWYLRRTQNANMLENCGQLHWWFKSNVCLFFPVESSVGPFHISNTILSVYVFWNALNKSDVYQKQYLAVPTRTHHDPAIYDWIYPVLEWNHPVFSLLKFGIYKKILKYC